jgi:hypothetical protein
VTAQPPRAEIYVDGLRLGRAPLTRKLPAGEHRVRLVWRAGQEKEQTVVVPVRGTVSLELGP